MRILHILQPHRGGTETIVRLLVRAQAGRHDVGIVCPPTGRLAWEPVAPGVRVWTLAMAREVRLRRDLRHMFDVGRVIRDFRPDLIHAHSSKAGALGRVVGRAYGVPVVYSPQNFAYRAYEGGPITRGVFYWIERMLQPLTSFLVASCHDELHYAIRRKTARLPRCATVYNAVDVGSFGGLRPPSSAAPVVGTYSRLYPQKDPANLMRAISLLRSRGRRVQCRVIGDGPLRPELDRLSAELGLESAVELVPDPGDAREALSKLDVYVQPSRSEAFPLGLMEAMAAGRAVIATRVGGVTEMIRHGQTGLLVPAADAESLAAAIDLLLEQPNFRAELAQAARDLAERKFDYRVMAERIEVVYDETIRLASSRVPR